MSNINTSNDEQKHDAERIIKRTWVKITHLVEYKTHSLVLARTAEDIAAEAIEYALKDKALTWEDLLSTEAHLFRVARKVAQWRICDEIKKSELSIVSYELGGCEENEEGEQQEISKAEADYSVRLYREAFAHEIRKEDGRMALSRLDGFLSGKGVSDRDINVFKSWALYNMPTDVACRKYSVTPTNLHKIVCVVRQILRTDGHLLLAA